MYLSIVVPCYNEKDSVSIFHKEIEKTLTDMKYEIIFVNDGSSDNTLDEMKKLADTDLKVKYISFSRNFGKESALYAGLKNAKGDLVCVMDVDLQDPPSLLPQMIDDIGDYDVVATRRVTRKGEPVIRSFLARMFYQFINRISKIELVDGARDYRVMTRQVVNALLELNEYNRFSKGLFAWVGFKTKWIEYENVERVAGETSWSFWGLLAYSIEGIVAFTAVPLSISTFFGILFSIIAFILIIFIVVRTLIYSNPVAGWASTVTIILFLGGIQLFSIGILGKYLEKTYTEVKNRPIYIVGETNIED
ncbi:glycosyltransferase family 2 protein [uncultured Methanobrevibacter sp.]|uniref:glycosyltransferase family 2 protein n=1 Tax=uncultured Methanobrevibacter sp. TaxID=253161 RepID=UPI0025FB8E00|nr:glycosyltransferase family 2 protein [uncultured Methanobrevibacter sp.]